MQNYNLLLVAGGLQISVYEAFPQFSKSDTPKFSSSYLQYFSGGVGGRDNGIITQMMIIVK
jgi:hypothetical protein